MRVTIFSVLALGAAMGAAPRDAAAHEDGAWRAEMRPIQYAPLPPPYRMRPVIFIPDYRAYGLPVPPYGMGWSRQGDEAVLIDAWGRVYARRADVAWRDAPPQRALPYDYGHLPDEGVTWGGRYREPGYSGTWTGTWTGADGRTYSGTWSGNYHGDARPAETEAPPPYLPYGVMLPAYPAGGYFAGGYYYPAPVVTTITVQPAVVTTTRFIEERVAPAPPRRTKLLRRHCGCK